MKEFAQGGLISSAAMSHNAETRRLLLSIKPGPTKRATSSVRDLVVALQATRQFVD